MEDEMREKIAALEARLERAESDASRSLSLMTENEARLKSMQHRIDEAEGREEAAARDIHSLRLSAMKRETQARTTLSLLKVFGSLITALSVLIQIGRAVLL